MSKERSDIKNIVTVDAYHKKYYLYRNDRIDPIAKLVYNKQNFVTTYIDNKDLISTLTQVSRNIPEEDIAGVLEIKAYEELGLDQAQEYNIFYFEVDSEEDDRLFHIFVIDNEEVYGNYLAIKEETKYIDLLVPAPLLYKSIYKRDILPGNGVDCFLYFTYHSASIVFYKDGNYLYSKHINYSLDNIYDKFCEIEGEQVDREEFFAILETEGLKATNPTYQNNFMKIFGELFITINDIIIYTKRAYRLDSIDHFYVGSILGPIIGLDEYSNSYLGLNSSDLNFDYGIESDEWYTDQYHYLMVLTSIDYMEDASSVLNMTIYPRPPVFAKRASGQFIIAMFAAVSVGLIYPIYHFVGAYTNKAKLVVLEPQAQSLKTEEIRYKKILSQKRKVIEELKKELAKRSELYASKTKTLKAVYREKVDYRLKSGIFYILAEELVKFNVFVNNIELEDNHVILSLISQNDRQMTELIKDIVENYSDQIAHIDISNLRYEKDHYIGELKVVFK